MGPWSATEQPAGRMSCTRHHPGQRNVKGPAQAELLIPSQVGSLFLPLFASLSALCCPPSGADSRASTHHGVHGEVIVLCLEVQGVLVADADLCMALEE